LTRIYGRLEAIMETIGLDASTLREEAIPKDFSEQRRIAEGDVTVLAEIEKRLKQFTRDPRDDLAEIINERGIDWVKNLPDGIGAIKRGGMNAVFALFTDGEKHYWRLKNLDGGKVFDNHSEIIRLLLSGEGTDKFYLSLLGSVSGHDARHRCCTELVSQSLSIP
jgi:hypothetical protein